MAPSTRRGRGASHRADLTDLPPGNDTAADGNALFIDPMLGTPLAMYVEKDVYDRDEISRLITKSGGTVASSYSGVTYILVDPHRESGQNLWRQYAGKKGKIVLDARWIHECVRLNQLQTFVTNWAGCKVTGKENLYVPQPAPQEVSRLPSNAAHTLHPQPMPHINQQGADPQVHHSSHYPYQVFSALPVPSHREMNTNGAVPQPWQASSALAPQQPHIVHPPAPQPSHIMQRAPAYREDTWDGYHHNAHTEGPVEQSTTAGYDYRYRDDHSWVSNPNPYYEPSYDQTYNQPSTYLEDPSSSSAAAQSAVQAPHTDLSTISSHAPGRPNATVLPSTSTTSTAGPEVRRGRKRTRSQAIPAPPATQLVSNRGAPARSPTPPTRVIKSTYGGNLFTADDVLYLKKYIDYCQEQGLVLSLREICERIAVKAPHHTFYSWRRYCNKHQIRLGGYMMTAERSQSPNEDDETDMEDDLERELRTGLSSMDGVESGRPQIPSVPQRVRSPTPPKALFRSTTGKGVAFTEEDVRFLVKFMEHRKAQGKVDMVVFWKDVAAKAPHHSRASWMKFWRRHKHELDRTEGDDPLPVPPDKKMRYSKEDDILLAKYFYSKPEGTSDRIFQQFGRINPHHPWKGWQEHHRIHKAKIDHLIEQLGRGENIDILAS